MKRESTLCHSFVNLRTHLEFCTRPLNWANVTHRRRSLVPDVLEQHMAQKLESFRPPHRKELMARRQALYSRAQGSRRAMTRARVLTRPYYLVSGEQT